MDIRDLFETRPWARYVAMWVASFLVMIILLPTVLGVHHFVLVVLNAALWACVGTLVGYVTRRLLS